MSKHHYALALARVGARVSFLEPFDAQQAAIREEDGVQVVNGFEPLRGLRHLPTMLRKPCARRAAKGLLKRIGSVDVVWSFDNSRLFDLEVFKPARLIHHCMDANMDFEFERAARSADVCAGVTQEITQRLAQFNPNSTHLPHGWAGGGASGRPPKVSTKTVFYAGNLAIGYIHWEWLLGLVRAFPETQFVFAGNADATLAKEIFQEEVTAGIAALKALPNVELLGSIPAKQLPGWYAAAHALLLVYDFERFGGQVHNSHKLTEYLASGTPVVATYTHDFAALDPALFPMAQTGDQLQSQLSTVLELTPATDLLRQSRMDFARAHAYPQLVERMAKLLSDA